MAVTCKRTDWAKGMGVPRPVNDAVATEVLDYLFNTNTWKTNPDALILKVRRWRETLWSVPTGAPTVLALPVEEAEGAEAPQPSERSEKPDEETWAETAVQLRLEGRSWNQIKAVTGKSISTIRDAVKRAGVAA